MPSQARKALRSSSDTGSSRPISFERRSQSSAINHPFFGQLDTGTHRGLEGDVGAVDLREKVERLTVRGARPLILRRKLRQAPELRIRPRACMRRIGL
jgi:hypothetical protein